MAKKKIIKIKFLITSRIIHFFLNFLLKYSYSFINKLIEKKLRHNNNIK